jgi:ABC-2 type transport system ATP-binding protein
MNSAAVMIEMRGLGRDFGKTRAVESLDLTIGQGEIFGLVGPDGAGKTTTLRLLAAIMDPTRGWAKVAGFDTVRQAEAIKRRIGYMAQQFSLYGDLSVAENLDFFADIFGVRGRERKPRINRLLDFAHLQTFRQRRAIHLSGGMQKKLALACTLVHQPEIILLDEPTTGVDPVSRREFWDILTDLHIAGTTILVSTPYMDEAERCSRIGLLYRGQLMVCASPDKVRAMVPGDLLEFRPASAEMATRGKQALADLEGVLEIQTYGDLLHVFVDSQERREPDVIGRLAQAQVTYTGLRQAQPRMEEAFISLIQRQDAERRRAQEAGQ